MSDEDRYNDHIAAVLQECPEADRDEVKSAFQKYEEEFFIPPQDAIRSIIRRFKVNPMQHPQRPKQQVSPIGKQRKWAGFPN